MNLFSTDGLFARFLYLVADIVTLHFLWLICSLPVFTIGASTTALCYAWMKRIRTGEGYLARNFLRAFRENFKQATLLWLVLAAVGLVLGLDFRIAAAAPAGVLRTFMLTGCVLLFIPYLFILLYIFPVQAKFDNPARVNLKNAFLMSFQSFRYTLVLLLVLGSFGFAGLAFPPVMGLLVVCGAGLLGYLTCCVYVLVFRRYLPEEQDRDAEAAGVDQWR